VPRVSARRGDVASGRQGGGDCEGGGEGGCEGGCEGGGGEGGGCEGEGGSKGGCCESGGDNGGCKGADCCQAGSGDGVAGSGRGGAGSLPGAESNVAAPPTPAAVGECCSASHLPGAPPLLTVTLIGAATGAMVACGLLLARQSRLGRVVH